MAKHGVEELKTTAQVSEITGQAPRTIQIHAKKYQLGRILGSSLVFTSAEIEILKSHRATGGSIEGLPPTSGKARQHGPD